MLFFTKAKTGINIKTEFRFIVYYYSLYKKPPLQSSNGLSKKGFHLLPAAGLEPARGCPQQILSLPRLPFRHAGIFC